MKYILITTIHSSLSEQDVLKIAEKRKNHFKIVSGLIRKFWVKDEQTGIYYGIFEFESKSQLENYLNTDFAKSVSIAYKTIAPIKMQILKVQKEQNS